MKRPFGQHFLFDPNILKKIIAVSGVSKTDTVVEIGPGLGTLTKFLAFYAWRVTAIEIDKKLIGKLEEMFDNDLNVEIIRADAIKFPYETIEDSFRVVANIPYNITTPLIFKLLEFREKIPSMTLLMQREVAKRITARPGTKDYGVLSISTQLYTRPTLEFKVSRKAFLPPPDVDSAVVHFEVSPTPLFNVRDEAFFLEVVKTAFSQRRKMLANSLKEFEGIKDALDKAAIDPKLRPEKLGIEDFARLSNSLSSS
jgi:16S rRNA (adenine1518-N6/adenine1519-N6)-dimethyltransferase